MKYGQALIAELERDNELMREAISRRIDRITNGETDWEDCFVSQRCEERRIRNNKEKIDLIKHGGLAWFLEYATLDGTLIEAHWCKTRFGTSLRAEMPDGSVVWTSSSTAAGLAKKGIKQVLCLRPAWFAFRSPVGGMAGVYSADYVLFPSDTNYATGEPSGADPIEIKDYDRKE